jgi:hypothetical protein
MTHSRHMSLGIMEYCITLHWLLLTYLNTLIFYLFIYLFIKYISKWKCSKTMIFCCVFFDFSSDLQFANLILVLIGLSRIPCFISIVKATIYVDHRVFHFSLDLCHRPPRYVAVVGSTRVRSKNSFGTSVTFFVQILTVCLMLTCDTI